MSTEYRVIWKRVGLRVKRKRYLSRKAAERMAGLLGPEPWKFRNNYRLRTVGLSPDALYCCDGHECGCGGLTNREQEEEYRKDLPPIEWIRIEQREVAEWQPAPPKE